MKKSNQKNWTVIEEVDLDHLYASLHQSIKVLAKRFNCTQGEIRRKLREMEIEQ